MIGSLTLEDIVFLVVLWFFTAMLANLFWTRFVLLRYTGQAFKQWLSSVLEGEDPAGIELLSKFAGFFFHWMGNAKITTGNKIKVATDKAGADGKPIMTEIDETLSPVDMMAKVFANYALMKIKAQAGGTKTQLGNILREEAAGMGGLSPTAAKKLTEGHIGPALMELAAPYFRKGIKPTESSNDTSSGGGWRE